MPRRRAKRQCTSSESDGDSSDSEDCSRQRVVQEEAYRQLELAAALRRPADFATAAAELAAIIVQLYSGRCSKAVQALVLDDIALAIHCCDGRLQSRTSLAVLMEAVDRRLPQAKRSALQRRYRSSSVQLRRRERRQGGGSAGVSGCRPDGGDSEEEEEEPPACFSHLPAEVITQVFRYLDPVTLARSACVSREWRAAAGDDTLWEPHFAWLLSGRVRGAPPLRVPPLPPSPPSAQGSDSGSGPASGGSPSTAVAAAAAAVSYQQRYAVLAQLNPERLLPWRTNRIVVAGRLAWWVAGQHPPASAAAPATSSCCHVGSDAVITFLMRGTLGSNSRRSSSSSDSSSDSGSGAGGLSCRLKFWQI